MPVYSDKTGESVTFTDQVDGSVLLSGKDQGSTVRFYPVYPIDFNWLESHNQDVITFSESFVRKLGYETTERFMLYETSYSVAAAKAFTDSLSLASAATLSAGVSEAETVTLSEAAIVSASLSFTESVTLGALDVVSADFHDSDTLTLAATSANILHGYGYGGYGRGAYGGSTNVTG